MMGNLTIKVSGNATMVCVGRLVQEQRAKMEEYLKQHERGLDEVWHWDHSFLERMLEGVDFHFDEVCYGPSLMGKKGILSFLKGLQFYVDDARVYVDTTKIRYRIKRYPPLPNSDEDDVVCDGALYRGMHEYRVYIDGEFDKNKLELLFFILPEYGILLSEIGYDGKNMCLEKTVQGEGLLDVKFLERKKKAMPMKKRAE